MNQEQIEQQLHVAYVYMETRDEDLWKNLYNFFYDTEDNTVMEQQALQAFEAQYCK